MARLVYSALASLDGFTVDATGNFDWAAPDEEVHTFVNDLERPIGTYLYGRRMYETMQAWETMTSGAPDDAVTDDYAAIWQAADKVVYSTTLTTPTTARTRIERVFDPGAVRALTRAADADVSIGGPTLAAHAIRAGLVDEWQLFLNPVVVGGGTPLLPAGVRVSLELLEQRRFDNGVVYLRYRTGR